MNSVKKNQKRRIKKEKSLIRFRKIIKLVRNPNSWNRFRIRLIKISRLIRFYWKNNLFFRIVTQVAKGVIALNFRKSILKLLDYLGDFF